MLGKVWETGDPFKAWGASIQIYSSESNSLLSKETVPSGFLMDRINRSQLNRPFPRTLRLRSANRLRTSRTPRFQAPNSRFQLRRESRMSGAGGSAPRFSCSRPSRSGDTPASPRTEAITNPPKSGGTQKNALFRV